MNEVLSLSTVSDVTKFKQSGTGKNFTLDLLSTTQDVFYFIYPAQCSRPLPYIDLGRCSTFLKNLSADQFDQNDL